MSVKLISIVIKFRRKIMSEKTVKIRLKGHETFILREGWLAKGLKAVADNSRVFSENAGADALGVGTNMAKAIRYWLRAGGITVESKGEVGLSHFGELIQQYDSCFEDSFTLWMFHSNIACNAELSTSWYIFFNRIGNEEYTKEELEESMFREIKAYSKQEIPRSSVAADVTAIINMYSREKDVDYDPEEKKVSPFSELSLLKRSGSVFRKYMPSEEQLPRLAVLYLIERYFYGGKTDSVSIDTLLRGAELPGRIYNLSRVSLNSYLDKLSADGYIAVNRTAGLDMVYLQDKISPDKVIEKYYEDKYKTQRG